MTAKAYLMFVLVFVVLPVIFARLMRMLWEGYNMQFPEKGRMGVWLHTFTLPVRTLQLLARVLVYKAFGRRIQITSFSFPHSIMPIYGVAPANGEVRGVLRFFLNSLPLWFLPLVIWFIALICPCCNEALLIGENWSVSYDFSILSYLVALVRGALQLFCKLAFDWSGGAWKILGLTYVIVCLSVDFGMTTSSIRSVLPGLGILSGLGALVFLLPISSQPMTALLVKVLPTMFYIQSAIVMIVLVGTLVLWGIIGLRRCWGAVRLRG